MQPECVIYCRVSSENQTKGTGLSRQLNTCLAYAAKHGYYVAAVFSEVCSGVDSQYVRQQAERMAKLRDCKIVCESHDRWSRKSVADLPPGNVEMASEAERVFEEEINKLFTPAQQHMISRMLS